jgi:hypothetical protein
MTIVAVVRDPLKEQLRRVIGATTAMHVFDDARELVAGALHKLDPLAMIIGAGVLDDALVQALGDLEREGSLPPVHFLGPADAQSLGRLWSVSQRLRAPRWHLEEIPALVNSGIIANESVACREWLIAHHGVECPDTVRLLNMLATDPSASRARLIDLCANLDIKRRTLFERVRCAGLPAPEFCQALFRLLPAARSLRRGEHAERAAAAAFLADARTLAESLDRRLGLSIRDARSTRSWRCVVDAWIETNAARTEREHTAR